MKKIIISGLATMAIAIAVLIGCAKKNTDIQSATLTTSENTTSTTKNARLTTLDADSENGGGGNGGGQTCNCKAPQTANCKADCTFSSCCVCWNPNTHEGGCGCIGGFASCRTLKLTARAKNAGADTAAPMHKITIYDRRVRSLFKLLKSKYKEDAGLIAAYALCKSKSVRINYTESYKADETSYEKFIDKYTVFVNSLTETQRQNFMSDIKSIK